MPAPGAACGNAMRLAGAALAVLLLLSGCGDTPAGPSEVEGHYAYPEISDTSCPAVWPALPDALPQSSPAAAPTYQVRKPANYNAAYMHPLLVVYAPSGATAVQSERYVHLTNAATSRGFIVAYADHRPMGLRNVKSLSAVARAVAKDWCVDPARIYMSGHSDGGTVSTALALLPETRDGVNGIAPSAAGFNRQDLQAMQCRPNPIPVMVIHGVKDKLFPGWGRETSQWWGECNKCAPPVAAPDADGCVSYQNCAGGAPVVYCETPLGHVKWPGLEARIIDFLLDQKAAP